MMKIKRQNDNKARVIMSNGDIREVKYKSELLDKGRTSLPLKTNRRTVTKNLSPRMTYGRFMNFF